MSVSTWFDYDVYMTNKVAQLKAADPSSTWDVTSVAKAFEQAGFAGAEGAEQHFLQFGAAELVNPNALFNAEEYITSKTVNYFKITDGKPTSAQVAEVSNAISKGGMTPWSHYVMFGSAEGLEPSFSFDPAVYYTDKATVLGGSWTAQSVEQAIASLGITPLEHFMMFGGTGAGEVTTSYTAITNGTVENPYIDPNPPIPVPKPGDGFDLTRNIDNLTGTTGSDTFFAANIDGFRTLNAGDIINGNGGNDTLMIADGAGAENFASAKISGVSNVFSFGHINVATNADVKAVTLSGHAADAVVRLDQAVTYKHSTNAAATVSYTDAHGKADAATVALSEADLTGLTVNGVEKLTLDLTGRNAKYGPQPSDDTRATFSAGSATQLITTGEGSVKLVANAAADLGGTGKLTDLDFTANKGGTDLALHYGSFKNDVVTVKGGEGNDKVIASTGATTAAIKFDVNMGAGDDAFEVHAAVHKDAKFDGGEGTDTLVLSSFGTKLDATVGKQFANFEAVTIKGDTTYTHGYIKGIEKVAINGAVATDNVVVKDINTLLLMGTGTQTLDMNATGVVDLTFDNGRTGKGPDDGVHANGVTSTAAVLNLHSNGYVNVTENQLSLATGNTTLQTVTVDGDQDFNFTLLGTATALKSVNTTAATGEVTIDIKTAAVGGANLAGYKITVGNGGSTITGSLKSDTIIGGEGEDIISVSGNTANTVAAHSYDKLTGGGGNDTFDVSGANLAGLAGATVFAAADLGRMTEITDFSKGDKLTFASGQTIGKINVETLTITKASSEADLSTKIDALVNQTGGADLQAFTYNGDTYLVAADANALAANVGADVVVKLTGIILDGGTTDAAGVFTW